MQDISQLTTPDGTKLHVKTWAPAGEPTAIIVLVHGLAEHVARYEHVANQLNAQGYLVVGCDLRGHGKSEGKRIYVHRFDAYVEDLNTVLNWVSATHAALPRFLLAHSMGTTVALHYLVSSVTTRSPALKGVVLSATALLPGDDISPLLISISGVVSALAPKLPTVTLNSSTISRDPEVVADYHADPLVYNGKIPARTAGELNRVFKYLQREVHNIKIPLLIMHGDADQLTNPQGSALLYNTAASSDKTLKWWPGLYHEIFNEPEQQNVINYMQQWIAQHL
ncbi:MAG: lysophospholipase [Bacteroidota bacterium]